MELTDQRYWEMLVKRGVSRLFILWVLREKPMHGYKIAKKVKERSVGCCSPTPGTTYPLLSELEIGGYVTVKEKLVKGRARKIYALTAKGRKACSVGVTTWSKICYHITSMHTEVRLKEE